MKTPTSEFLSLEEEEVLAMMRNLVAEIRQRARSACMEELRRSLVGLGAKVSEETSEATCFALRRARFRLRVLPTNVSSVELTFIESEK